MCNIFASAKDHHRSRLVLGRAGASFFKRFLAVSPPVVVGTAVVATGLTAVVGTELDVLPESQPMEKAADSVKARNDAGLLIVRFLGIAKRGQLRVRTKLATQ
jgi:hypothetical protein